MSLEMRIIPLLSMLSIRPNGKSTWSRYEMWSVVTKAFLILLNSKSACGCE